MKSEDAELGVIKSLGENNGESNIDNAYFELTELLSELTEYHLSQDIDCKQIEAILSRRDMSRRDDIQKSRLVNDFHHAHDAYLNIVVGNVYYVKFTQNPLNFIKKDYDKYKEDYNLSKMFDWDVKRNGEVAWIAQRKDGAAGTITTVKRMLSRNTPLMTRYSFDGKGGLTNETLYSAKKAKGEGYIPFKSWNILINSFLRYHII